MNIKKSFPVFLLIAVLIVCMISPAAATSGITQEITYLEDGSYIVTTLRVNRNARMSFVSGNKSDSYYSVNGSLQWTYTVYASFTYDGVAADCYSSSSDISYYDPYWTCLSERVSPSGNTVYGSASFQRTVLGIVTNNESSYITISCDANGNIS